jgi:hypothetical protein
MDGCTATFILTIGIIWRRAINLKHWMLYLIRKEFQVDTGYEAGWVATRAVLDTVAKTKFQSIPCLSSPEVVSLLTVLHWLIFLHNISVIDIRIFKVHNPTQEALPCSFR